MRILITFEDRIRPDSTGVYFRDAFSKLADIVYCHPEELEFINPKKFDLFVKIDDGLFPTKFPDDWHPSVYYVIDTHIDAKQRQDVVKESKFNYVFCAQRPAIDLEWECENVNWLPLACDPNYHYAPGKACKQYDVCFVGNVQPGWQNRRVKRIDTLFKEFPNFYFGNVYFRDMALKFQESRLIFNSAYSNDINMRVFEALCSGSALLTDKQNWQLLFKDDYHLISYSNNEEMIDKAKFYLKNAASREAIAKRGQINVMDHHTYKHRAEEILKICSSTK